MLRDGRRRLLHGTGEDGLLGAILRSHDGVIDLGGSYVCKHTILEQIAKPHVHDA